MAPRRQLLTLGLFLPFTLAQNSTPFDCHVELDSMHKFDLTALKGEYTMQRTRETPPTNMVDEVRFNVCGELAERGDVAPEDQCPTGTWACLTKTNQKGEDGDRIVAVIPLAQGASLSPEYSPLISAKGLSLVFHGSQYPTTDPIPQSFNLSIICSTEASDPQILSYERGQLRAEWNAPAGCFSGEAPPKNDEKTGEGENGGQENSSVGSGVGWFFLLLLIAFVAYFVLGAYYNYSTYGATGADLIPHRDFWRDVPYLIRDVVSHLCSSFRPRRTSSRGGYIAV